MGTKETMRKSVLEIMAVKDELFAISGSQDLNDLIDKWACTTPAMRKAALEIMAVKAELFAISGSQDLNDLIDKWAYTTPVSNMESVKIVSSMIKIKLLSLDSTVDQICSDLYRSIDGESVKWLDDIWMYRI